MRTHPARSAVCIFVMLTLSAAPGGQPLDVPGQVDRAVRLLLSPDSSDAQCIDGVVLLLDAIVATAPATRLAGPWQAKLSSARELVARGRTLSNDAVALLNDSYRAVNGKPFMMPAAVRSVSDARDHIRGRLSSVRGLLDKGRADEAIQRMLEAVLMVVTPVGG